MGSHASPSKPYRAHPELRRNVTGLQLPEDHELSSEAPAITEGSPGLYHHERPQEVICWLDLEPCTQALLLRASWSSKEDTSAFTVH